MPRPAAVRLCGGLDRAVGCWIMGLVLAWSILTACASKPWSTGQPDRLLAPVRRGGQGRAVLAGDPDAWARCEPDRDRRSCKEPVQKPAARRGEFAEDPEQLALRVAGNEVVAMHGLPGLAGGGTVEVPPAGLDALGPGD